MSLFGLTSLSRKACVCQATTLSLLMTPSADTCVLVLSRANGLGVNLSSASTKDSISGSLLSSLGPGSLLFCQEGEYL